MTGNQHTLPRPVLDTGHTRFSPVDFLRGLLEAFLNCYGVYLERRSLERLDSRQLRDIGLTREAALREAARPFWDNPRL